MPALPCAQPLTGGADANDVLLDAIRHNITCDGSYVRRLADSPLPFVDSADLALLGTFDRLREHVAGRLPTSEKDTGT